MTDATPSRRLPARDFILLPLISLLTVVLMLAGAEVTAQVVWPEQKIDSCLAKDPIIGQRARPSCVARMKSAEGPWMEDRYNDCGYRSAGSCHAPIADRLVVMGSSTSWGYLVPYDEVWSTRTAKALSAQCGRPVDVQSLSGFSDINADAARTDEALAMKPRMVVLVITAFDMLETPRRGFDPDYAANQMKRAAKAAGKIERNAPKGVAALREVVTSSRAVEMAQHFMFQNEPLYVSMYLRYGDKAGFLRPPFSPSWQARLAYVDDGVAFISSKLAASGVRMGVLYVPQQAQAALASSGDAPAGVDPMALSQAIGEIARKHGATFIDANSAFKGLKDPQNYFYTADGHPNGKGHELIARTAAARLGPSGGAESLCPSTPGEGGL